VSNRTRPIVRKLITLPAATWEAVERFQASAFWAESCPTCGHEFARNTRAELPSDSDALRRLVEFGLQYNAQRGTR
jgi:hypothetical protein